MLEADLPIEKTAPIIDDAFEAESKLRSEKATDICDISAELLKTGV